jgi:hypothetical protein
MTTPPTMIAASITIGSEPSSLRELWIFMSSSVPDAADSDPGLGAHR